MNKGGRRREEALSTRPATTRIAQANAIRRCLVARITDRADPPIDSPIGCGSAMARSVVGLRRGGRGFLNWAQVTSSRHPSA